MFDSVASSTAIPGLPCRFGARSAIWRRKCHHLWLTRRVVASIIVAKAGKRVYMLYQLKRAGIGQHDLVTIYVSVIRPVLEYACPVWHTNLNNHLTESIETVQKRALKCIYPGNEYADILCLTNLPCLKERGDSLCKKYFQNIMETTHRLNYLLPCQRCNQYGVRRFKKYPLPEIRTNRYRNSLIPWGLYHWQ